MVLRIVSLPEATGAADTMALKPTVKQIAARVDNLNSMVAAKYERG